LEAAGKLALFVLPETRRACKEHPNVLLLLGAAAAADGTRGNDTTPISTLTNRKTPWLAAHHQPTPGAPSSSLCILLVGWISVDPTHRERPARSLGGI